MKNYETLGTINIPANVVAYLQKHAEALLTAPAEYSFDVFKQLMGYGLDYQLSPVEQHAYLELLSYYNGEQKQGIFGVINGGEPPVFNADLPDITGVICNIEIYKKDATNTTMSWENEEGNTLEVKFLAKYVLDLNQFVVGYLPSYDAVSYFKYYEDEDGLYSFLEPIEDEEEFAKHSKIWKILLQAREEAETLENE